MSAHIPMLGDSGKLLAFVQTSVDAFDPDKSEEVAAFREAIESKDKNELLLLGGDTTPQDIGIETSLSSDQIKILVKAETSDRESAETRAHEIEVAKVGARGPMWGAVTKYSALAVFALVSGLFGVFISRVLG